MIHHATKYAPIAKPKDYQRLYIMSLAREAKWRKRYNQERAAYERLLARLTERLICSVKIVYLIKTIGKNM